MLNKSNLYVYGHNGEILGYSALAMRIREEHEKDPEYIEYRERQVNQLLKDHYAFKDRIKTIEKQRAKEVKPSNDIGSFTDALRGYAFLLTKNREEAKDLAQDTFVKAIELDNFEKRSSMLTWLLGIMRKLYANKLKEQTFESQCERVDLTSLNI